MLVHSDTEKKKIVSTTSLLVDICCCIARFCHWRSHKNTHESRDIFLLDFIFWFLLIFLSSHWCRERSREGGPDGVDTFSIRTFHIFHISFMNSFHFAVLCFYGVQRIILARAAQHSLPVSEENTEFAFLISIPLSAFSACESGWEAEREKLFFSRKMLCGSFRI